MSTGTLFVRDSRTGSTYNIPIHRNAVRALDLQRIRGADDGTHAEDQMSRGLRVYDPGLQNTAVLESAISFSLASHEPQDSSPISNRVRRDHERNALIFRGYTLEQLWGADFEDMFHLLMWGRYPSEVQRTKLSRVLAEHMQNIPKTVHDTINSLPKTTAPLPLILAGLSAYLACLPDIIPASNDATIYQENLEFADSVILKTVACYAVVFALVRCHRNNIQYRSPSTSWTYFENLFFMAGLTDSIMEDPDALGLSCYRRFCLLNADHGMATSVFATLVTASSLTDPISCLISAITAAHGPLHFGATESAQRALKEIADPNNVPAFIHEVKSGKRKLFGFGHREYKGVDPRVRFIQSILMDLPVHSDPLFKIAESIEAAASKDEYFQSRHLYPNADFYGNFIFTAIGIEPELIPAAMLSHRIMGIMAHWREYMVVHGRLLRPSHIYSGDMEAKVTPHAKI